MQLRRIVTEFPKIDPTSYAFTYNDTATFEEEVDEWFSYNEAEFKRLNRAKDTFYRRWKKFAGKPWLEADKEQQEVFVKQEVDELRDIDLRRRCKGLQTILHVVLGVWDETAGLKSAEAGEPKGSEKEEPAEEPKEKGDDDGPTETKPKTRATEPQLEQMKASILLVTEAGGIALLYQVMQNAFKCLWCGIHSLGCDSTYCFKGTMNFGNPNSWKKIYPSSRMSWIT
jgi:hypothetical protein